MDGWDGPSLAVRGRVPNLCTASVRDREAAKGHGHDGCHPGAIPVVRWHQFGGGAVGDTSGANE